MATPILNICSIFLAAAARHGGTTPADPPSGGATLYRDPALDALDAFTLVLWARQNPLSPGAAHARLLQKPGAWDLMPNASGLVLALGPDPGKTSYTLIGKPRLNLTADWCFFAVAVSPNTVAAYTGGRRHPFAFVADAARRDRTVATPGELVLGNFSGIRPFNGWMDRVRVFRGALDEPALRALFEADLASAKNLAVPQVAELGRAPATNHCFRLAPSAVPFSTRWPRTNALDVIQAFHATHCLWVYGSETGFIRRVQGEGLFYQGTLNGLQGQEHSTTNRTAQGDSTGRHENLDGNKNTPAWMVTFGPKIFTGCCNHPAFRKFFFEDAKRLIDAGVDSIHVDDWEMNASWVRNAGVCFCDVCRSGFRDWLARRCSPAELKSLGVADIATFDYREHLKTNGVSDAATYRARYRTLPLTPQFADFQIESMRIFFKDFRGQLDTWSPATYIPVSVNGLLTPPHPDRVIYGVDVIDFLQGESSLNAEYQTANEYVFGAKIAEAVGITQVISPIPRSTARTRAALATTYALGQPHLVPWDLYMGSDATGIQPRYFGTREQYGDLYDFVRDHRDLLDTHVSAAEVGVLINGDQPGAYQAFCLALAARQIPFHVILGASRYARVPLRAEDLRPLRLLVEFSPAASFCAEDQAVLKDIRASGLMRFVPATADVAARCRLLGLDLLRLEGPDNLYAFPRVNRDAHSAAIHVVNWNLGAEGERAETYRNVTLSLLHPARWGAIAQAVWHEPGEPPVTLVSERHADCIRLTLPQVGTWGIIELR